MLGVTPRRTPPRLILDPPSYESWDGSSRDQPGGEFSETRQRPDGLWGGGDGRGHALLDDLAQPGERQARCRLLLLENDLSQRRGGQVRLRGVVDDANVVSGADHCRDVLEGDVAALPRVVQLAVRVAFDGACGG